MMDIAKWEVSLEPSQQLRLRGLGGEALFGLVLAFIRRLDEDLASELHDARGLKPISVSCIDAGVEPRAGIITVPKGTPCQFSFSTLSEQLTETLFRNLDRREAHAQGFTLSGAHINIASITLSSKDEPVPGTSYQSLLEEARPVSTIRLRFMSPTSFRRDRDQVFLPIPELIFNSLLSRWNAFSPHKLPESLAGRIKEIRLAKFKSLSSSLVTFSSYRIIGFTGEVGFIIPRGTPQEFAEMLDSLSRFAYYSGVGYKTTMGMGTVELMRPRRRS